MLLTYNPEVYIIIEVEGSNWQFTKRSEADQLVDDEAENKPVISVYNELICIPND